MSSFILVEGREVFHDRPGMSTLKHGDVFRSEVVDELDLHVVAVLSKRNVGRLA
jgi:hypothetical protein